MSAPIRIPPQLTAQHARRRIHPEGVIPLGIFCYILYFRQPVSQKGSDGQTLSVLFSHSHYP